MNANLLEIKVLFWQNKYDTDHSYWYESTKIGSIGITEKEKNVKYI